MKKICFLADRNIYLRRICNFLAERDFEIHLICRNNTGLPESQFHPSIKFYQLKTSRLLPKMLEIRSLVKKISPDIVHIHQVHKDALLIPELKRKYKYILTFWGSDLNLRSQKIIDRIVQNFAILLADRSHLLSSYFLDRIKEKYYLVNENKVRIFFWGIDADISRRTDPVVFKQLKNEFGITDKDRIVLSYRNHSPIYNHRTLIKSMPEVLKKFPYTKFIFTRGSCDRKYLDENQKIVKDLGIDKNFIFIDRWLEDIELSTLINNSEISVSIPLYDGLPATLFEIMASSSIPLISRLDSYKAFFNEEENGFILQTLTDEKVLSNLLIKILELPDEKKQKIISLNNKQVEEKYNWNKQSDKFLELYIN